MGPDVALTTFMMSLRHHAAGGDGAQQQQLSRAEGTIDCSNRSRHHQHQQGSVGGTNTDAGASEGIPPPWQGSIDLPESDEEIMNSAQVRIRHRSINVVVISVGSSLLPG